MQRHYENAGEIIKHNIVGIFQAEFIKHVSFKGQSGNMKFADTATYHVLVGIFKAHILKVRKIL
jgi:hypothetical protein